MKSNIFLRFLRSSPKCCNFFTQFLQNFLQNISMKFVRIWPIFFYHFLKNIFFMITAIFYFDIILLKSFSKNILNYYFPKIFRIINLLNISNFLKMYSNILTFFQNTYLQNFCEFFEKFIKNFSKISI